MQRVTPATLLLLVPLLLAAPCSPDLPAAHWPQWLGPERNGHYPDTDVALDWPDSGPKRLWQLRVGEGFSGPVALEDRLILFHRLKDHEVIDCLETSTGKRLWRHQYPTRYQDDFGFDEGPRSTPTLHEGSVFTYGAEGVLSCVDLQDGRPLWTLQTGSRFNSPKGFFGRACSPLVVEDLVMVNLGAPNGAGIAAFDVKTGDLRWTASRHQASYASPVAATINGQSYAFFFHREGLAAVRPSTGKLVFEYPWRPSMQASVNAATPLVVGDRIFLSTSYGKGAVLLEFDEQRPRKVWSSDEAISSHYSSSVHHQGYLYGFHGRQERGARLRCVELDSGQVQWEERQGLGSGWVLVVRDHLLILTENGELILSPARPSGFKIVERTQVLGGGTRPCPALSHGRWFGRDTSRLVALEL